MRSSEALSMLVAAYRVILLPLSILLDRSESAAALGLARARAFRYVLAPQILRRLMLQAINLATRMIKSTLLVILTGVIEVLKVGQQIIDASRYDMPRAAIWI